MSGYTLSAEAEEDVFQIWRYLAEEAGVRIANGIESKLYEAFQMLVRTPGLGHKRSDLTEYPSPVFSSSTLCLLDRLPIQNSA